jgi:hypothetical protein
MRAGASCGQLDCDVGCTRRLFGSLKIEHVTVAQVLSVEGWFA